ncbi:hypothetical protein IAU60_005947 [Kwoniella sp. DSM 27419]
MPALPVAPLQNPRFRHISRSAAKRESVQMLGSIRDLQLHFARGGLVEHRAGAGVGVKGTSGGLGAFGEEDEGDITGQEENRPPRLAGRSTGARKPWKEVELARVDAESARAEARGIVSTVRGIWGLSIPTSPTGALPSSKSLYFPLSLTEEAGEYRSSEDIHSALVSTAQSIRRIRSLALSISHSPGSRKVSGSLPIRLGGAGKLRSSLSTPSRPAGTPPLRTVSGGQLSERKTSLGTELIAGSGTGDHLAELRKAALEVLTSLRALEERLRVGVEASDYLRPKSALGSASSTSESTGDASLHGHRPSPSSGVFESASQSLADGYYDSDEDDLFNLNAMAQYNSETDKHASTWEERIVAEKREYRVLDDGEWEREARVTREGMGKWVAVVEGLFAFANTGDIEELEDWAREEGWDGRELERVHSFLLSHLPIDLALRLPPPGSDNFADLFLSSLSDGYLLIHAYNAALLQSSRPWGLIPDSDVHDTLSSCVGGVDTTSNETEEGRKRETEWTFRKVGNLTCWGAALRHRYQLPVTMVTTSTTSSLMPLPSPSPAGTSVASSTASLTSSVTRRSPRPGLNASTSSSRREEVEFDPMTVAKRSEGWSGMLGGLAERWVREVVGEIVDDRRRNEDVKGDVLRGGMI